MDRPASVNQSTWDAFREIYNAIPENRRTLDMPTTNAEALAAIRRMVHDGILANAAAGPATEVNTEGRPENLKASDIPVFTHMSKFTEYYSQLRFFMRGQNVSANRCQEACFLILSKWEGPQLSRYAQEVDAGTLARANWTMTRENILVWLNEKFRSKTDLADANARWLEVPRKLQAKHYKSGLDFYLAFETELADYNSACIRTGRAQPAETEITRHFVNALPPAIAARVRETASDLDTNTYGTYKTKIANVWTAHQVADIKINQVQTNLDNAVAKRSFSDFNEDLDEGEVRPAQYQRGGTSRQIVPGRCRLGWEEAPPELQGPIFKSPWMTSAEQNEARARWTRVNKAGVCARCRGKRLGHLQDTFEKLEPFGKNPTARVTTEQSEVDNQLNES